MSDGKDIRWIDAGDDYMSLNIFAGETIISIMLERDEIESMTQSLVEWCGMPVFKNQIDIGDNDESLNDNLPS